MTDKKHPTLKITMTDNGDTTILLDGHDVSKYVSGFRVQHHVAHGHDWFEAEITVVGPSLEIEGPAWVLKDLVSIE